MTLPGPITRGSPRRTYSEATAAATLSPTMPTVPTPTAATVWGSTIMVGQVDEVVEDLDFGEPLLELPGVPLLQGAVAGVLHQTRIPRLEKLNIQVTTGEHEPAHTPDTACWQRRPGCLRAGCQALPPTCHGSQGSSGSSAPPCGTLRLLPPAPWQWRTGSPQFGALRARSPSSPPSLRPCSPQQGSHPDPGQQG